MNIIHRSRLQPLKPAEAWESHVKIPGSVLFHSSAQRTPPGQILLALKQPGMRPEGTKFGIWMHWLRPSL